jgi:hypothetical protein
MELFPDMEKFYNKGKYLGWANVIIRWQANGKHGRSLGNEKGKEMSNIECRMLNVEVRAGRQ